jgi:hypothetical protein
VRVILFLIWRIRNIRRMCFLRKAHGTLRQASLSRGARIPFLKALPRFRISQIPYILLPFTGTSNKWLPVREHPSDKESLPLEPAVKTLNAGYRKKQKSLPPPQVRSCEKHRLLWLVGKLMMCSIYWNLTLRQTESFKRSIWSVYYDHINVFYTP